jgi:hypothetical protein
MTATIAERQLLAKASELGLDKNLHAIAVQVKLVEGTDISSPDVMLDPCIVLEVVPDPVLDIKLRAAGATRRGRLTWTVGLGEEANPAAFRVLMESITPGIVWPHAATYTSKGPRDLFETTVGGHLNTLVTAARVHHAAVGPLDSDNGRTVISTAHPRTGAGFGAITIDIKGRRSFIRAYANQLNIPGLPEVKLNQRVPGGDAKDAIAVRACDAVAAAEWLVEAGVTLLDDAKVIAKLRKQMAATIVAHPTPGQPAIAQVTVGRSIRAFFPGIDVPDAKERAAFSSGSVPALKLAEALDDNNLIEPVLHPGVKDIAKMALAAPYLGTEGLYGYQAEAVGLHLSTELGYLNSCSPGMGKTVMALVPMSVRAKATKSYRGLVVAEANVRKQWAGEAKTWFPEATVVTIVTSKDITKLIKALGEVGTDPLLVITSYAMLNWVKAEMAIREVTEKEGPALDYSPLDEDNDQPALFALETILSVEDLQAVVARSGKELTALVDDSTVPETNLGALLLDTFWHDLIADEAEVLRGTGKQASAMWEIRRNAGVAVALTGTPINRGLDDLGRLLAWVRNDDRLFRGVRLSEQFDLSLPDELTRFATAMGPIIFRRDTSEVADEMPTISPDVIKLRPSAAEKSLADAALFELKRVYTELVAAVEHAESLDPENPAFQEARTELTKARGAWLGGTQLARMAASDPASLLDSKSRGAALLEGQGLIGAATQVTGTKRLAVVADVVQRVANGHAVLVFTEFATVATGLIADFEAAGIRVGSILGGGGAARDRMVTEFQNGDLDVLVSTSSGEKGLNLQRASVIVHYDLPWTPKGIIQRTGRARRLKSVNKHVTVVFPLMEGTVEEKVAATVVARAIDSMRALDTSRGVDSSVTEMGLALGGLAEAVSDTRAGRKEGAELMEITKSLVG